MRARRWDFPPPTASSNHAIVTALALAYVALASGDRVMLRVLGGKGAKVNPSFVNGRHRIVELARRLHDLKPGGQFDFATSLATELLAIRRAGKVFIVSDFLMLLNSVTRGLGMFTAASMDLTAVQILGGRELNGQGLDGDVEVVDSESGERLRVSIGERERTQYRETMLRLTREIKSFCLKRGLHYALYTTDRTFSSSSSARRATSASRTEELSDGTALSRRARISRTHPGARARVPGARSGRRA